MSMRSAAVLGVGLVAAASVPWLFVRRFEPPEPPPVAALPKAPTKSLLTAPPPVDEPIRSELALELGAELSGAWLQDREGFLWIGSYGGGLYRWDGLRTKRYATANSALSGSNVTALHEDADGLIWVGTLDGLDVYDKDTGVFRSFPLPSDDDSQPGVWTLHPGRDGVLWIGTNGEGLLRLDPASGDVAHYLPLRHGLPSGSIYRIAPAGDDALWLATFGGGAARFDLATERVVEVIDTGRGLPTDQVWSVHEDRRGTLWIGTQEGLARVERASGEVTVDRSVADDPRTLGGPVVTDIREAEDGSLWLTHFGGTGGLSRRDPEDGSYARMGPFSGQDAARSRRGARAMFEDRAGIFWVVAMGGLVEFDPSAMGFNLTSLGSGLLPITQDQRGQVWLGTMDGLRRYDTTTGQATPIGAEGLRDALVTALAEDGRGRFWVATYGGDLSVYDRDTDEVVQHFAHDPDDPASLPSSNCIRRILVDRSNPDTLWLLTQGGGLAAFDTTTGTARRYQHDPLSPASLSNDTASYGAMLQDPDGVLWVGTDHGLNRLAPDAEAFTHFRRGREATELQSDVIQALHRDARGALWVGTADGLHRLEPDGSFTRFGVEDGLSDDVILGILGDEGTLWLSTPQGLTAFDPTGARPPRVYRDDAGLQGNAFLLTSFFKTRDGEFWFGGPHGVNHFRPDQVGQSTYRPPIVLTGLTSDGVALVPDRDPCRVRDVTLTWPVDHFEFEVAALSFSAPTRTRYRYRLRGLEDGWFESDEPGGRYGGLPPGQYLLEVQAATSPGDWGEQTVQVRIEVTPPFWRSWWFGSLVLAALGLLAAGVVYHIDRLRSEITRRRDAEARHQQAVAALADAARSEALGRLAAGVAHDFNNLLMVVLGGVDRARMSLGEGSVVEAELRTIEHAALSGADLNRQLLAFSSRNEAHPRVVPLNRTLLDAREFFTRVLGEHVEVVFDLDEYTGSVLADPGKLHQILLNLVINARNAMPRGGRLEVSSTVRPGRPDQVGFSVSDTGIGMDDATQARIFDPYFSTRRHGEGTGLGLATVREIVRNHHGEIEVQSTPGAGTTFTVWLPRADTELGPTDQPVDREVAGGEGTVLLVEDSELVREAVAGQLRRYGWQVVCARGTEEARRRFEADASTFVALVTDAVLEDGSGRAIAELARRIRPDLPVLFITGYTADHLDLDLPGDGAVATLTKPFQADVLAEALEELLGAVVA